MSMSRSRRLLTALTTLTGAVTPLVFPSIARAQTSVWQGVCVAADQGYADVATIQGIQCLLANVMSVFISLIGIAGFIMMVVGSFRYIISGGNSKGADTAKNTITFAVVGLAVALSAFVIINLIALFTGVDEIKFFVIPTSSTGL